MPKTKEGLIGWAGAAIFIACAAWHYIHPGATRVWFVGGIGLGMALAMAVLNLLSS